MVDDRSFVASEQLAQSGRIAMQEASYFTDVARSSSTAW